MILETKDALPIIRAMGLTVHYEFRRPAGDAESKVLELLSGVRARALELPLAGVSQLVRLTSADLTGPWPMQGLAFKRLEDVVDVAARWVREDIYRRHIGIAEDDYSRVDVPLDFPAVAIGFAVALGPGSEPAAFGLAKGDAPAAGSWSWYSYCKTQYASVHGDDNFLRCHESLIAILDAAGELGFDVVVRDDTKFWESRDKRDLLARVADMNRLVARFAGAFVDHARATGLDSHQVQGGIFEHPDFERLETED